MRGRTLFALGVLLLAASCLAACGDQAAKEEATASAQSTALWTEIQQLKSDLDAKKAELSAASAQLATPPAAEGGTDPAPVDELKSRVAGLEGQGNTLSDQAYGKLIEFINASGIVEGQSLTPEQRAAFDLKADMDIAIAREYIDRGGDYQRAVGIYDQSLMADEGNSKLLAAKEEAERLQFMDEARFSQVKKGMTEAEVRAVLGTVKSTNVREFTEKDRLGWFYRKQDGSAAGVYFKRSAKDSAAWVVETADYNAVKAQGAGEDG